MANNITRWRSSTAPNTALFIDPGVRWPKSGVPYCGSSFFVWGKLAACRLFKVEVDIPPFMRMHRLVSMVCTHYGIRRFPREPGTKLDLLGVERPMLYVRGKARPQDIIDLREIYGAFMGGVTADAYAGPTPSEWKGGVDKVIEHEKIVSIADGGEKIILVNAQRSGEGGLSEHVIDSFGIGLYVLGRMETGGIAI